MTKQPIEQDNGSRDTIPKVENKWGFIIALLIGFWMIAMSILAAGYLISREVAKNDSQVATESGSVNTELVNIEVPAGLPVQGDNNAPVTIVEFADFQCPFCGEWHTETYPQLKKDYIDTGKARFVYMDFAFLGEESFKSAEAARCAADQGKFWEYHDKLFESQAGENEGTFTDGNLKKFASEVGLNTAQFNSCFDARVHKPFVEESTSKAQSYGVNSTPTVFINGIKLEGAVPYINLKQIIDAKLSE